MPHRTFNLDGAAEYLHLSKQDVRVLVKDREIPFDMQGDRPVFTKRQLDAWASQRILGMSRAGLSIYHKTSSARVHDLSPSHALLSELLNPKRIAPELRSKTKASVIRDMVKLADATDLVSDPADLLDSLIEREKLCSTAIPGGIALLHPRHHEPYMFVDSFLVLGRSIQPIHAGSPDGKPTDLFFLVCCQNDKIHLHTLARLCSLCHDTNLCAGLRETEGAEGMMRVVSIAEEEVIRQL